MNATNFITKKDQHLLCSILSPLPLILSEHEQLHDDDLPQGLHLQQDPPGTVCPTDVLPQHHFPCPRTHQQLGAASTVFVQFELVDWVVFPQDCLRTELFQASSRQFESEQTAFPSSVFFLILLWRWLKDAVFF